MHHRIFAVKYPMIRVRPFDPHTGFVAGYNPRGAQNGLRLLGLDPEPIARADKHVHQRALAHIQAESIPEQAAQPLVGQRLKALEIDRQRVNARPKRRRRRDGGRWGLRLDTARRAAAGKTTMANHARLHRRYVDLVVFANQIHVGVHRKRSTAAQAHDRLMVMKRIRLLREPTIMRLMPRLRTAGTRALAIFLLVRRRRLR